MDNMILKRLVASILALSLATNGNISLASSPGEDTPAPNKGEERDKKKKEGAAEVKEEEKEAKEEERKEEEEPQEEKKEEPKSRGKKEETEIEEEEEDISGQMEEVEKYKEEMKEKLHATLLDPKKQEWIEVKIIQRLKSLDTNDIFSAIFNRILLRCEEIRTPYKDPHLGWVHKISVHGKKPQEIPVARFKDSRSVVQSLLGREIGAVAWEILDNLYDPENRAMALNMIRELNVMQTAKEFSSYNILFERINQIFYHSRRLLTVTIAPQIIEKYVFDMVNPGAQFDIESFETVGEEGNQKQQCTFAVEGHEYICEFSRKKEGKFFGSVVEVRAIDESKARRYYLKAHQGYPAVNKKDSNTSYFDTTTYSTTLQTISADEKPIVKLNYMDLREPFMYKVLEQLGYGPKTYIMINPYINYGLYIVTEDLNSGSSIFFNIEGLKSRIDLNRILNPLVRSTTPARDTIVTNLTEVSILSYIFNLCDLHSQNWGYIATEGAYGELKAGRNPSSRAEIRIIDFLLSKDTPTDQLEEKFLRGQIPGVNGTFSQVLGILTAYLDALPDIEEQEQEAFRKLFETKIQQGQVATRQLHEHIRGRELYDIIEKTKRELLEQLTRYPLICVVLNPEETSMESAAAPTDPPSVNKNSYIELENYCKSIHENYDKWNAFIAGDYIQWLKGLLEKTPEKKE